MAIAREVRCHNGDRPSNFQRIWISIGSSRARILAALQAWIHNEQRALGSNNCGDASRESLCRTWIRVSHATGRYFSTVSWPSVFAPLLLITAPTYVHRHLPR
eukprot:SAG31_NODE_4600_length_3104_cov_2.174709_3_plen_103_part_00